MEDSTVNLINKNGVFDGETLLKIELINKEKNEIENQIQSLLQLQKKIKKNDENLS